jgi:pimeloyl-ACP methyl ester carboxylesterase
MILIIFLSILVLFALFFVLILLLTHFRVYVLQSSKIKETFKKTSSAYTEGTIIFRDQSIFYRQSGNGLPLLFIHGSPGSADVFVDYQAANEFAEKYTMVTYDRPGYGRTSGGMCSLAQQVQIAHEVLLARFPDTKVIIVGHSYGGTIAALLALEYPEVVEQVILLAPMLDPIGEEGKWWKRLSQRISFISYIAPFIAYPFRVSAKEIYAFPNAIRLYIDRLQTIQIPIKIIMGTRDFLVPMSNITFAKNYLDSNILTIEIIPGMSHFIPQHYPKVIKEVLLK